MITCLLIHIYAVYISFLVWTWICRATDRFEQGVVEYWENTYISEKLLVLFTIGVFVLPPFVVTYVVVKWTLKIPYKIYKHMKRVFTSDHKWFV